MSISPSALPFKLYAQNEILTQGIDNTAHSAQTDTPESTNAWLIKHLINNAEKDAPPQTILDIGIRYGKLAYRLQKKWGNVTISGIDNSPTALRIAQKVCPKAKLYCHDLTSNTPMPIMPESQDLVVCTQTLKYLTDANKTIKEMIDKLKPGAIAAFSLSTHNGDTIRVLPEFSFEFALLNVNANTYSHPFSSITQTIKESGGILLNEQHESTNAPVQNIMVVQKPLDAGL